MHYRVAAVFLAASLIAACTTESRTTPTSPSVPDGPALVRISGRLIDYRTTQRLANMVMNWSAFTAAGAPAVTAVSDANGNFEVSLPAADRYAYSLPSGNTSLGSGLMRIPWKRMDSDLLANGGPCAARYGYVYDAVTREPIEGARVLRAGAAMTDSSGYYRIDIGCEPYGYEHWGIGTTTVSVSHPAYQGAFELDGRREGTSFSGVRRVDFALQPIQ